MNTRTHECIVVSTSHLLSAREAVETKPRRLSHLFVPSSLWRWLLVGFIVTVGSFGGPSAMLFGQESAPEDVKEGDRVHGDNLPTLDSEGEEESLQIMDQQNGKAGKILSVIMAAVPRLEELLKSLEAADQKKSLKAMLDAVRAITDLLNTLKGLDEDIENNETFQKYMEVQKRLDDAWALKEQIEEKAEALKEIVFDLDSQEIKNEAITVFEMYVLSEFFKALEEQFGIKTSDAAAIAEFIHNLRDPAVFADQFLEQYLAEWLEGAETFYNGNSDQPLKLKIELDPNSNVRLFSKHKADVGLRAILTYAAGSDGVFSGFDVVVEGVRFHYREGGHYSVDFDLVVNKEESLKRTVIRNVDGWIDRFLAELDLPVTIDVTKYPFSDNDHNPFIECTIGIDLTKMTGDSDKKKSGTAVAGEVASNATGEGGDDDSIPVVITADRVRLYADRIDWRDTTFRGLYKEFVNIAYGVGLWEMGGYARPGTKEFGPNCKLGYELCKPEIAHIRLCGSTRVPQQFEVINHCGGLYIFNQKMSHFVGHTDFRTGRAWGKYFRGRDVEWRDEPMKDEKGNIIKDSDGKIVMEKVLGEEGGEIRLSMEASKYFFDEDQCCGKVKDVSWLGYKEGQFLYERGVLTMTGHIELFKRDVTDVTTVIDFSSKTGTIDIPRGLVLFGQDVGPTFSGTIDLSKNRFDFTTTVSLEVPNLPLVGNPHVEVTVEGEGSLNGSTDDGSPTGRVVVKWESNGVSGEFTVDSLDDLTPERLFDAVRRSQDKMLPNFASAASKWAKEKSGLMGRWASHWQNTLHTQASKLGPSQMHTGDAKLDQLLGDIARGGNTQVPWNQSLWGTTGVDPNAVIGKVAGGIGIPTPNDIPLPGGSSVGGLLNGGKKTEKPSGPSPEEQRRIERSKAFVQKVNEISAAIETVRLNDSNDQQLRAAKTGVPIRSVQELHVAFQHCATASAGDGHGDIGLTVHVAGFDVRIDSKSGTDERKCGSAITAARIEFQNLVPNDESGRKPTARIIVSPFEDSSGMHAEVVVRHKLQELVELYLPEVEILGRRKFVEKQLAVQNSHSEPLVLWVQLENRSVRNRQFHWSWDPGQPGTNIASRYQLAPGATTPIALRYEAGLDETAKKGPLHARRLRLWVETESGQQWAEYLNQDLWLVDINKDLKSERAYDSEQMATCVCTIPRVTVIPFSERWLVLQNSTPEPLRVNLRYLSMSGAVPLWQSLDNVEVAPGQTVSPTRELGLRIRASQVHLAAEGPNIRYTKYEQEPLSLVEQPYKADHLGSLVHIFASPNANPGNLPKGSDPVRVFSKPDFVRVPGLIEANPATALSGLRRIGLRLANGRMLFDDDLVVGSNPEESSWAKTGDSVTLIVRHRVPALGNMTVLDAVQLLRSRQLIDDVPNGAREADIVINQSLQAGTPVDPGSTIALALARRVPSVLRISVQEAQQGLQASEFQSQVAAARTVPTNDPNLAGMVAVSHQEPQAGSLEIPGSTVRLWLIQYVLADQPPVDISMQIQATGLATFASFDNEGFTRFELSPDRSLVATNQADGFRGQVIRRVFYGDEKCIEYAMRDQIRDLGMVLTIPADGEGRGRVVGYLVEGRAMEVEFHTTPPSGF